MVNKGTVKQLPNGNYQAERPEVIQGRVDHVNQRFCYIVTDSDFGDIWVKEQNMKSSLHEDIVEVSVYKDQRHGYRPEGVITRIVDRTREEYVGRFYRRNGKEYVDPDNKKVYFEIAVSQDLTESVQENDKVLAKVEKWPGRHRGAIGTITQVLGKTGEHEAEIHSIMAEFNLPFKFPESIEAEAADISDRITSNEIKKRRDFRDVTTFTIDPVDAKDFDDAISFRHLENGNYEVGVHIADVSHYVQPGSSIEKEAQKRATSVYLVDRTIPMLPEKLSNGLCSLRPKEDKLTYAAVFEIDANGRVFSEWFGRTIIHSDRRFTYEEAQERIETREGDYYEEINILNDLAHGLRDERFKNGSINFETPEYRFQLDEDGSPIRLAQKVRKDAHKLVEDFMLLANKRVAEFVQRKVAKKKERTFVYRTHDLPNQEKLLAFAVFAKKFGHQFEYDSEGIASSLNSLIEDIQGKPEENVLQILAIRSMSKAIYTTSDKPHFGLAFPYYTHFTSPIRRYPDLMVHRLLTIHLNDADVPDQEIYEQLCKHSSVMEKNASDAERASIKYKQVEYMSRFLGEEFEGIISGITEWGMFVEIVETKCEGMVRISEISDDHYSFDEMNYRLVGLNKKRILTLGDHVTVQVAKTDIDHRTIDLELVVD
jgi:ribonuclease R